MSFSTYVQRADQPKIYLTASAFRSGMDKQVKDLRDKKIVDFKEDDVTRVALRGPDGDVVLAKADGNWKIEQPAVATAPTATRCARCCRRCATCAPPNSPAMRRRDADLATYGLDSPAAPARAHRRRTATRRALLVGKETEQGLYVKAGRPADDVRRRQVGVARSRQGRQRPARQDGAELRSRRGDGRRGRARRRRPLHAAVDRRQVVARRTAIKRSTTGPSSAFVGALSRLARRQVLGDAATDLATYGLANPSLNITVKGKDGVLIGTVRAGSRSANPPATEYTVKRDDKPTVFQMRDFQFKQLDKKPAEFIPSPPAPPGARRPAARRRRRRRCGTERLICRISPRRRGGAETGGSISPRLSVSAVKSLPADFPLPRSHPAPPAARRSPRRCRP